MICPKNKTYFTLQGDMNDVMTSKTGNVIWHLNNKFIKESNTGKMSALNLGRRASMAAEGSLALSVVSA
jgi:hypothetical protein